MRRPLYGWLTAETITLTGTRVSMVALPLLVLTSTGSAVDTGLVALAEMLPLVLMKVLAGPVIDRVGARRVAVTCNLASVVVVGGIPLLYDAGHLGLPGLLLLVALAGALRGPSDAAAYALLPTLVHSAGVPMERATGLHSVAERTASMGGAALAGVLVVAVGPANALLLDAASFGVAAGVLAWATAGLRLVAADSQDADPDDGLPYLQRLREGWQFLRREPVLLGITVMVSVTNLLDAAWSTVLMPVWAVQSGGGAAVLGLLFATFSGGSVLGSLCAASFAERLPRFWVYLVAFMIGGLPRFVVLVVDSPVAVMVAVFAVGGFASGFINPILGAVMFERIPARLTGRVSALSVAASWSLMPFGGLLGGVLVDGSGLSTALMAVGVAYFAATMLPALDPRWRDLDRRPEPAAQTGMTPSTARVGTSTDTVSG